MQGLSLTIEQTHCWNEQGVGRYINDDDDSNSGGGVDSIVEYDAFLVPAQFLYRIDQVWTLGILIIYPVAILNHLR
jgi:hypothetical protein